MTRRKIVVDSDIIAEHLVCVNGMSMLRRLMAQYFCYTTVFHAAELFACARSPREMRAVEDAMSAMKVLGMNPKNARAIGQIYRREPSVRGLIAGLCRESGLPIVTMHPPRYRRCKGVKVIPVGTLIH